MGLTILILGLLVFLATHVFVTMREARAATIERLGLNTYRVLFSIVSLGSLALIVWGFGDYRAHGWIQVWSPPGFMRHVTVALMLPAVIWVGRTPSPRAPAAHEHEGLSAPRPWPVFLIALLLFLVIPIMYFQRAQDAEAGAGIHR